MKFENYSRNRYRIVYNSGVRSYFGYDGLIALYTIILYKYGIRYIEIKFNYSEFYQL